MAKIKPGYIYVLENPSFPGMVKIGMTNQSNVNKRVAQLSTGVPTPFTVAYQAQVSDPATVETVLHKEFDHSRVADNREWFEVSAQEVKDVVWKIDEGVRYRDNLFLAIEEWKEIKFEISFRNSKYWKWTLAAILPGTFIIVFSIDESLFEAFVATFVMFWAAFMIGGGFIVPTINKIVYSKDLLKNKIALGSKYSIDPDHLEEYSDAYYREEGRKYRSMSKEERLKKDYENMTGRKYGSKSS
jgi:hypothetical protein